MTKLVQRGHEAAASLLVMSIALLALSLALLAVALFPASGLAAPEPGTAEISFSPAPLDFGKTTVGTETQQTNVDVYNYGGSGVMVDKVTIEGGESGDFKLGPNNCSGWLPANQHCSVSVAFAPGGLGARGSTLGLQLQGEPEQALALSGTGVEPKLTVAPGSYDFGIQRVNRGEGSVQMQIVNSGEATTTLNSVGFGGPNANNFWTNGGDCWNGRMLQVGESCNVQVVFNPWDTVPYEAQLQAYAAGATFSATLTGTGGRPQVEPDSMPTELGSATVGTMGPVKTIVFSNHGNIAANFFIGIVAGGDSGSFRLLDENCSLAPLAPSGSCTAHVRFTPQGAGPKLARMAFFGDDDSNTGAILSGEGVAAAVTLAPEAFDFGPQATNTRGAAHAFAVHNDGSSAMDLDSVAIVGADVDQFALAGDECSGVTLAPGEECLVRVRFAPDSAGAKAATLRVRGTAGTFVAALSGKGVEEANADGAEPYPGASGLVPTEFPRHGGRRGRHRRFSRGNAVISRRGPVLHRVEVRARTIPR